VVSQPCRGARHCRTRFTCFTCTLATSVLSENTGMWQSGGWDYSRPPEAQTVRQVKSSQRDVFTRAVILSFVSRVFVFIIAMPDPSHVRPFRNFSNFGSLSLVVFFHSFSLLSYLSHVTLDAPCRQATLFWFSIFLYILFLC
jgi:hypothetical protein